MLSFFKIYQPELIPTEELLRMAVHTGINFPADINRPTLENFLRYTGVMKSFASDDDDVFFIDRGQIFYESGLGYCGRTKKEVTDFLELPETAGELKDIYEVVQGPYDCPTDHEVWDDLLE